MKSTLQIGDTGTLSKTVGQRDSITLGGQDAATVLSTPSMINLMEHAAREALRPHLEPGEESVGVDVHVEHTSATPTATTVTAEATVTVIEKNVIAFEVMARDEWGEIGRGTHRRAVIKTDRFATQLAEHKPSPHRTDKQQPSDNHDSMPAFETLQLHRQGARLNVTLNRPGKRNAINSQMTSEMEQLVDWLSLCSGAVRVVVVTGAGDTFCAGDDVTDLQLQQPQLCAELSLRRGVLYERITRLPQVWIAGISGTALGGGFVLACACDFRIASHQATMGLPEVRLGWPPNYGLRIVESLLGRGAALQLALTGKIWSARNAESMGLVKRVVAASQLESAVHAEAQEILDLPPHAVAATKQLFGISDHRLGNEEASEAFIKCLASAEARKSIAKFDKR
jgi:enoyl-CoA hydratase/carnithine racemase/predicted thioesterase